MLAIRTAFLTLISTAASCVAAEPAAYTYESLDYAATGNTYLYGLNDVGDVCGATSALGGLKGFIYDGSDYELLSFAFWSPAHGISNNREVCGILYPWNGGWGGYRAKDGLMTPTPEHASAHENHPYGINEASDIAGWYMQSPNGGFRAYSSGSGVIDPPVVSPGGSTYCRAYGINEAGVVVGDYLQQGGAGVGRHTFIYDPAAADWDYFIVSDGICTGYGINDAGTIVGTVYSNTYGSGSFILDPPYNPEDYRLIAVPGAAATTVRDINNDGRVVGYYKDSADRYHGFIGYPIPICEGDATGDGLVTFEDLNAVLAAWGSVGGPADLDGSGTVDFNDLNIVLAAWGSDCNA